MPSKKYTPEQLRKELENLTNWEKEIKRRFRLLQQELKHPADTTDSIYNMDKDTLQVAFEVYKTKARRGKLDKSYREFKRNVKYYATTPIKIIVSSKANDRQSMFYKRMEELGELDKAKELLDMLTEEERVEFFQSDYFFINRKKDSIDYLSFLNDNGVSVELARLQDYLRSKGYNVKTVFGDKEVTRKGGNK